MKDKKRALRRHHYERMKRKAKTLLKRWFPWYKREPGLSANNIVSCSCAMFRNPRSSKIIKGTEKLTVQELRAPKITDWDDE